MILSPFLFCFCVLFCFCCFLCIGIESPIEDPLLLLWDESEWITSDCRFCCLVRYWRARVAVEGQKRNFTCLLFFVFLIGSSWLVTSKSNHVIVLKLVKLSIPSRNVCQPMTKPYYFRLQYKHKFIFMLFSYHGWMCLNDTITTLDLCVRVSGT